MTALDSSDTAALTRRVTLMSVAVALVLVTIKAFAWSASGSVALLASMADSALDLIASLATYFAVRYAAVPPDAEHRFGHGKAEAFAGLVQGGLVFASAALIGREAIVAFLDPKPLVQEGWAIAVMVVSIILTGVLVMAQTHVLRQARSVAVAGDRAHYASDLASNLLALGGITAASFFGIKGFDAAAGLAVGAILLWGAVNVFRQAADQLMDHELPQPDRARIMTIARRDPEVLGISQLRTRASGPFIHILLHIELDPDLSLETAHNVIIACEQRLLAAFPAADITIHADPQGRAAPHTGLFAETIG
jgi:ferrous-iron efflux pump FieF